MKKFITYIIVIILIIFMTRTWWKSQLASVSADKKAVIVVVEKGESFNKLSKDLENKKLIKSVFVFNLYAKQTGLANNIKAGTFKLSSSMDAAYILKTLTSEPLDSWVTLLEGWRIEEMAQELNDELNIDKGEFLKAAKEGYMFPDTYLFPKDYSALQIVNKLKATFDQRYTDELKAKIKALGLTADQGVILASIVEREARSDEVRRMVASILLKRFNIGMALNADATIQYLLGYQQDERSWWKRYLSKDDLKSSSPYNTYLHAGLPPTPICNPSLSSLQAVATANMQTPYLYYYHDLKGNSYYSKTLEEHNSNVVNHP